MNKKIIFLLVVSIVFSCFAATAFAAVKTGSTVSLDGVNLSISPYISEKDPYYPDENIYLPLRVVSEALGYKVAWQSKEHAIVISNDNKKVVFDQDNGKINSFDLKNNSKHEYYFKDLPITIKNSTYVSNGFLMDEFNLKVDWDKKTNNVKLETIKLNNINIISKTEKNVTKAISTTLQYPEISGLTNKEVQNKINAIFKKAATDAKVQGTEALSDIDPSFFEGHQFEVDFNYQVKYNQKGLLSVVFYNYQYYGGAHGSTIQTAYTFNIKDGTQYKLSNMFKDKTEYVTLMSNFVKQQMKERETKAGFSIYDAFDKIDANHEFYLDSNGINVYFQQYAIGAYALGIPEFGVDYDDVRDVINPLVGL